MDVPLTTTILLVRHGQTESNITGFYMGRSDEDINERGYIQASCLASRLAKLPISLVYTSPLMRAHSTASILAMPQRLEPKLSDDLIEIQLGDWQGLHMDEIKQRWSELWHDWRVDPSNLTLPHGENLSEVTERAVNVFERIVGSDQGKQVVVVTHDVIIKVLVAHVLRVSNRIYRKFNISNASLSMIQVVRGNPRLVMLNDTSHFED
ncbi:histidine phosphatase family protein [Chloroflexota bacterium]